MMMKMIYDNDKDIVIGEVFVFILLFILIDNMLT